MHRELYWFILLIIFVLLFKTLLQCNNNCSIMCDNKCDNIDCKNHEHLSGAITQLHAKGLQDVYLTVDNDKYLPNNYYITPYYYPRWWWYNSTTPMPWNNPTRYNRWYYYPPYTYLTNYYY